MNANKLDRYQYLIFGPQFKKADSEIGGTTISFDLLCEFAKSGGKSISIIRTNKFQKKSFNFLNFLWVILFALLRIPKCELVFLNVSPNGMYYLTPILFVYSKIWKKKFAVRVFGGNENRILEPDAVVKAFIFKSFISKVDVLFLQTKSLVETFKNKANRVEWLPTSRKFPQDVASRLTFNKKLVYISQIHQAKGIDLIIDLKSKLPNEFVLDVFGPVMDEKYKYLKSESFYKGVLEPMQVVEVLKAYDILLLPTYHPGEGYPGIMIEAMGLGLPIICSNWLSLPELIKNGQNGFLVDSREPHDWMQIIFNITESGYIQLSKNALQSAGQFDWNKVNQELFQTLDAICKNQN